MLFLPDIVFISLRSAVGQNLHRKLHTSEGSISTINGAFNGITVSNFVLFSKSILGLIFAFIFSKAENFGRLISPLNPPRSTGFNSFFIPVNIKISLAKSYQLQYPSLIR